MVEPTNSGPCEHKRWRDVTVEKTVTDRLAHEIASEVIATEIEGLRFLKARLDNPDSVLSRAVNEAADACRNLKGRLIVTGMGKSGHVARKIAATLASTGTRASYVHPGEASHGDLGMISREDAILALSNSGETTELGDMIGYAGRFNITLMSMTSNPDSTLARAGDIKLIVPKANEACAITGAPTTSTTIMMALGDAIAVAILRKNGFTADDFHTFHPGGKLGAALKRVTELMHHTEMPLCRPGDAVSNAVEAITASGFGCAGVVDGTGRLIGIVTDGDLRRHFRQNLSDALVADIMTTSPATVSVRSLAAEALALLSRRKITALFIVDDENKPQGLLHVHDCLDSGVI